jgi:hypothetical protein
MPLSEREQRILQEIEQGLRAEDPGLAKKASNLGKLAARRMILAVAGLVLGLAITLGTFAFNQWLALGGFVLMVISGTALVQSRRARSSGGDGSTGGWSGKIGDTWRRH